MKRLPNLRKVRDNVWTDGKELFYFAEMDAFGKLIVTSLFTSAFFTSISTVTASKTLTAADSVIVADASDGVITLTMPTAIGIAGRYYYIKKKDSSANVVTIVAAGDQEIDGANSMNLTDQYEAVTLISDGAGWWVF